MQRSSTQLRCDALQIWRAGVDAVRSERLVRQWLRVDGRTLVVGDERQWHMRLSLDGIRRIVVVGAGKAGAGMAQAVEEALGPTIMAEKQLAGWVNVPADVVAGCQPAEVVAGWQPAPQRIHLHAARPAGVNEPRPEGVAGANEILRLVESLGPDDLCLCLISGGGSALMPAPVEGITLADKLAVTRHLSAAGANIEQLNTVRKQLSRIKGGGLLRACRAGRLVTLIISDVLGDPPDAIASGPTVRDSSTPADALVVLERFSARAAGISPAVFEYLETAAAGQNNENSRGLTAPGMSAPPLRGLLAPGYSDDTAELNTCMANLIIGNNATAIDAAAKEAERLGYSVTASSAKHSEGPAEEIGRQMAESELEMRAREGPTCLVSGGEPVVKLVESSRRGLGGRNQQLVLAALAQLLEHGADGMALLSGGTDGEDGPTDAAGAVLDADVLAAARQRGLDPADYLARNDAYHFFDPLGALIRTGPTHTNVCDLRVVVCG
jgi:hydroxypyruvate reductase